MATKKEILDITKEIRDLLYQNDVEGYKKIPQYAQIIYSYIENKSIHDNIIYQLQQNFKAQSVIGLADVLVNIEKIIDNSTEDINEYMKASYVKHHSVDIENFEKNKLHVNNRIFLHVDKCKTTLTPTIKICKNSEGDVD